MKNQVMTKEQFLAIELNKVSSSYVGIDNACRCGCKGVYADTSYNIKPTSEVNDNLVQKRLNKAKKLVQEGAEYDICDTYINISTGENRALTLYFDDVK